jgi:hypothetical protein
MITRILGTGLSFLTLLSTLSAAPAKGRAADKPNPDEPAIHDYILTMDAVRKYADVGRQLGAAAEGDKALAAEMKTVGETDAYNLDKAAMMEKSPRTAAFLKSHAMTAREFVLIPMTLVTAGMAVAAEDMKGKPPAFVNPANVKFVREHRAEIEKMNLMGGSVQAGAESDSDTDTDK